MKKFNNKGFVLLETLVVSVFVLTAFVIVYSNGLPLIQEYNKLEYYDDVDSLYGANLMREILMNDGSKSDIFGCFKNPNGKITVGSLSFDCNKYGNENSINISECSMYENNDMCRTAKNYLNITETDSIILTKSDPSIIKGDIDNRIFNTSRGISSYVDYLNEKFINDFSSSNYMLIISRTKTTVDGYLDDIGDPNFEDVMVTKFGSVGVVYYE